MPDADGTFKTAREELIEILQGMPVSELKATIQNKFGESAFQDPGESGEDFRKKIIERVCLAYDNKEEYRTSACRAVNIPTDEERRLRLMHESTIAAKNSAEASAQSAKSAASIVKARWIAVAIAVLALIVSFFAVCKESQSASIGTPGRVPATDHSRDAGPDE